MANYMIHACPQRMWYVNEFLVPSLEAQGIRPEIWNDEEGKGNLLSCMESFRECGKRDGGTWHIQDDVVISRQFAELTAENDDGVVCGFACQNFGPDMNQRGKVPMVFMWYSFQCIRLPNDLAGECADWFYDDAMHRTMYASQIVDRKHDDWFFREFMRIKHPDMWVVNLTPNLVDHIDHLIGGTLVNKQRLIQTNRAKFWKEQDLVDKLEKTLKER